MLYGPVNVNRRPLECPWASDLMLLSRVDLDDLWNFQLPTEYVPGTSRPTVDVVPTIYVLTSDSAMALITGRGRTLKKYTIEKDFAARKAEIILEIGHEMLWGKDLQSLVKANIIQRCHGEGPPLQVQGIRLLKPSDFTCGLVKSRWTCGVREIRRMTSTS